LIVKVTEQGRKFSIQSVIFLPQAQHCHYSGYFIHRETQSPSAAPKELSKFSWEMEEKFSSDNLVEAY
jgi:hypothetical protein